MFNNKSRNWSIAALALLACALATPASAINCNVANGTCFVIPAGGNTSVAATWSNTSGGAGGAGPPTTTSNVILDSAVTGTVTINASLSVGTFDCSGTGGSGSPFAGTLSQTSAATLTINTAAANSLLFSSGMTYSPATTVSTGIIFANTSGTAQVTSNGQNISAITVNGVGGTVQQLDDINVTKSVNGATAAFTITNGLWDANTHALAATSVASANSNVRGLTLGGTVTLGGNMSNGVAVWSVTTAGTFTFTKNSANMVVIVPTSAVQGVAFNGGPVPGGYNALTLTANTGANVGISVAGGNTFSSVTIGSGWNWWQTSATTTTLSAGGTFTVNGTQTHPVEVISSLVTGVATISAPAGTCASTWVVLQGVTATGGCTFTATNATDLGTNAGWSITPPTFGGGGGFIGIIGG